MPKNIFQEIPKFHKRSKEDLFVPLDVPRTHINMEFEMKLIPLLLVRIKDDPSRPMSKFGKDPIMLLKRYKYIVKMETQIRGKWNLPVPEMRGMSYKFAIRDLWNFQSRHKSTVNP